MILRVSALVLSVVIVGARPHPDDVLEIFHRARRLAPGEVVILDVHASEFLTEVSGQMDRAAIQFARSGGSTWRGLVGLDAEIEPGDHVVSVHALTGTGRTLQRDHSLHVEPHAFPVRRLSVPDAFVEPPPELAERIREDRDIAEAIFAVVSPDRLWTGAFVMPVRGPVTSDFGRQSILNGQPRSRHLGTDFRAPLDTRVVAPNRGRIALVRDQYFSGRTIVIDHGLGLYSLLAHLHRVLVNEGDLVDRGQPIALSGATGRVTGPHLHWSVRLGAARVDPVSLVFLTRR